MVSKSLDRYRQKRSAGATPEPFGRTNVERPHQFVVQKHGARRLHYDFRLEWRGVLLSWAVPRGPSLDPQTKRLAVQTEDHPVEYADFEGVIPEGNYGAGAVIVWDRGRWNPLEDPDAGLRNGKLLFDLYGHKLRGTWTLVRTKRNRGEAKTREWLLIKKPDAHADPSAVLDERSVFSGLTVEERRDGSVLEAALITEIESTGVQVWTDDPPVPEPMLATSGRQLFSSPEWIYEIKHDGFRLLAKKDNTAATLFYRSGTEATGVFPEVMQAVAQLPVEHVILDGEVVVLDDDARSTFGRLQQRVQLQRALDIQRAMVAHPATYYAFDLLAFGRRDLRELPLEQRKKMLRRLLPPRGVLRYTDHIEGQGEAMFAQVQAMGLEGMVAKQRHAAYRPGRSEVWLRFRVEHSEDFVVVGYSRPKGHREGFGALHLARYEGTRLVYRGRVGTGFSDATLKSLAALLTQQERDSPPCEGAMPKGPQHRWVKPNLVCEVRYREVTADGLLRQPVFLRMRSDKGPDACSDVSASPWLSEPPPPAENDENSERRVQLTHLDKVFWPSEKLTKGDLIDYYREISPWLLPYLEDRPVVLTRFPDGIDGKSFFQKDAPAWIPEWIQTERMWSEQASRDIDYFVCNDLETLLFLVNLGTIPLHVWSSRITDLEHPDWCILDLDPKGAPFAHVVQLAAGLHELCEEIGLPCGLKTSGSTGLHVLIPLGGQCTYDQSRSLAHVLARVVQGRFPEHSTLTRAVKRREGRVYLDYLQNGHGRLLVAPLSVRPRSAAPVSMPLAWSELNETSSAEMFTVTNALARVRAWSQDPLISMLVERPPLTRILQRLADLVD